ncbi:MAG: hypothetical protein N3A54_03270 [Patescibacteria group bacterium]|nr:hypothetical protein [Patescibacteria group bacterium]
MKKKKVSHHSHSHHLARHYHRPVRWLPLHGKFITPFFKFANVRGISRLFIEVQITLVLFILLSTLLFAAMKGLVMIMKQG